jgi:xanthine/uracil permease
VAVTDAIKADLAVRGMADLPRLAVAAATFLTAALVPLRGRGFLRLLPILSGVAVGYSLAVVLGIPLGHDGRRDLPTSAFAPAHCSEITCSPIRAEESGK